MYCRIKQHSILWVIDDTRQVVQDIFLSPQSLDGSLTKLIDGYTMRGASILVHCRGDLGRAGLVACCLALKIGLCGWINVDLSPNPAEGPDGSESYVRRDTLQLVEHAITVVRRR
ncbi:hypothetical protein DFJ58DRAFT_31150 [Suillus subalutaceus]|uniref:uncharacterized protein n=1 Tax=Suillus subalutaceus TaxID=48586 RepID=UPI001B85D7E2|nr:uncharacterized protein DFJ58DRAFT_31150 [Suillus subalutaceus]KAG1844197.1 hypothetical protein DFJ58DRAFT_31150 [Suillus subalutaceus]